MSDAPPDWAVNIPSTELIHQRPEQEVTRPFEQQDLLQIGAQFIEQFLRSVVEAVVGIFIPGGSAFDQLRDWAEEAADLPTMIASYGAELAAPILNLLGTALGIPNLGEVLQKLALLPSVLLAAATGDDPDDIGDDNILDTLLDVLRGIFGGGTPGTDPADTTPPTAPSLTLSSASYSTITVTASGAVDP